MSLSDATCYESERRAAAGPREAALGFKPYSNPNHGRHHPALVAPPSDQSMLGLHPGFLSGENQRSGGQGRTWQARSALGEGGGGLKRRPETHRKEPGRTASNYLAKRSSKTSPKQLRSRTSRTSRATFASHSSRTSPPLPPIPPAAGVKRRRVVTSSTTPYDVEVAVSGSGRIRQRCAGGDARRRDVSGRAERHSCGAPPAAGPGGEPVINRSLPKTTLLSPGKRGGATARSALRLVLAQFRCPKGT